MKDAKRMVKPSVQSTGVDQVGKGKLSDAPEPLECWRFYNISLNTR